MITCSPWNTEFQVKWMCRSRMNFKRHVSQRWETFLAISYLPHLICNRNVVNMTAVMLKSPLPLKKFYWNLSWVLRAFISFKWLYTLSLSFYLWSQRNVICYHFSYIHIVIAWFIDSTSFSGEGVIQVFYLF